MSKSTRPAKTSLYHILVAGYRERLIAEALERNGGRPGLAARDLGIHRNMVTRTKAKLGIKTPRPMATKKCSKKLMQETKQQQLVAAAESLYRIARGVQPGRVA